MIPDRDDDFAHGRRAPPAQGERLTEAVRTVRQYEPIGRTARFVELVEAKHGPSYVKDWLSQRSCEFTDTRIFTIGFGADTLNRDCCDLAVEAGVRIEFCPHVTKRVRGAKV